MKYREIQYLANTQEFQRFIKKYNLKSEVVNNEKIFLISECLIFEIYGLVVEDFFYFDIYSIDLKFNSNINRLLEEFESEKLQSVFQSQIKLRNKVLIPSLQVSQLQSNLELTLKSEVYFFTMIQLMDELLSNILTCEKEIKMDHWSNVFEHKKIELINVINKINKV